MFLYLKSFRRHSLRLRKTASPPLRHFPAKQSKPPKLRPEICETRPKHLYQLREIALTSVRFSSITLNCSVNGKALLSAVPGWFLPRKTFIGRGDRKSYPRQVGCTKSFLPAYCFDQSLQSILA